MVPIVRIFLMAVFAVSTGSLFAQVRGDRVAVETPGIALVKPQPWSKASQATVVKFLALEDRSARGTPGAGYYVFQTDKGRESQVQASQIVKIIIQPTLPQDIRTQKDREMLGETKEGILALSQTVPLARRELEEICRPLDEAIARIDAGDVRVNGRWQTLAEFQKQDKAKIETRLRQDMNAAKRKRDFDLDTNPYFLKLKEFSESDEGLKARLDGLRALYQKFVSREEQDEILGELQNTALPRSDADALLARLKSLPDPSTKTESVLKLAVLAERITEKVGKLKSSFETLFATPAQPSEVRLIPEDIDADLQACAALIGEFRAGSPPVGLWVPSAACNACAAIRDNLPAVKTQFAVRDYATALATLSPLGTQSGQIGPHTSEAMEALNAHAAEKVACFEKLRDEGERFARGGNKNEALAKLTEALAVMPDEAVAERIEALKKK